jgi:hypothetical protein
MARATIRRSDAHALPPVCCVCGTAATRTRLETFSRSAGWVSVALLVCGLPWLLPDLFPRPSYAHSLFSVACALPFIFGLLFARRSANLDLPVCERHIRRSRKAWVVFAVGLTLAVAAGFASDLAPADRRTDVILGAVLFGLASVVVAVGLVDDRVRATGIADRTLTLDRVSQEFADAVKNGERGPDRREAVPAGGMELATARFYRR